MDFAKNYLKLSNEELASFNVFSVKKFNKTPQSSGMCGWVWIGCWSRLLPSVRPKACHFRTGCLHPPLYTRLHDDHFQNAWKWSVLGCTAQAWHQAQHQIWWPHSITCTGHQAAQCPLGQDNARAGSEGLERSKGCLGSKGGGDLGNCLSKPVLVIKPSI